MAQKCIKRSERNILSIGISQDAISAGGADLSTGTSQNDNTEVNRNGHDNQDGISQLHRVRAILDRQLPLALCFRLIK